MNKRIEKEIQNLEVIRHHVSEMQRRHNKPPEKEKFICRDGMGHMNITLTGSILGRKGTMNVSRVRRERSIGIRCFLC